MYYGFGVFFALLVQLFVWSLGLAFKLFALAWRKGA